LIISEVGGFHNYNQKEEKRKEKKRKEKEKKRKEKERKRKEKRWFVAAFSLRGFC